MTVLRGNRPLAEEWDERHGRVLAGTGHRPEKMWGHDATRDNCAPLRDLHARVAEALDHFAPRLVISGMALGFDQLLAFEAVQAGIPFIAACPFPGFNARWPVASKGARAHDWLLERAKSVYFVCDEGYAGWKLHRRNEWLVDRSRWLLAYWDGTSGGTENCLAYADGKYEPGHYRNLHGTHVSI